MCGGAVAQYHGAANDFSVQQRGINANAAMGLRLPQSLHVNRKRTFEAEVLAARAFLIERPGLRQSVRRILDTKFAALLGGAANLASHFAVEASERLFSAVVLFDNVIRRENRVIEKIRERVDILDMARGVELPQYLRIGMGKANEQISMRARPVE